MISATLRRGLHEVLDHLLDVLAQEVRDDTAPKRNRRKAAPPSLEAVSPAVLKVAAAALKRANLRT